MRLLNFIVLFIFSVSVSCRENKHTSAANTQTTEVQPTESHAAAQSNQSVATKDSAGESGNEKVKDQSDSLMPLIISFYSIGEGIDRGQKEKLLEFLGKYEKKSGKKLEYSEVHWGREGETDYCFSLKGFSDDQVTDFIKGAKEALNTAEHVHFLQNQPCRKGR